MLPVGFMPDRRACPDGKDFCSVDLTRLRMKTAFRPETHPYLRKFVQMFYIASHL